MPNPRICSIEGCGKPHYGRGYCIAHYKRFRRHGDPTGGRTPWGTHERFYRNIILTYRSDECLIWPFAKSPQGYGRMNEGGVHVLVCEAFHGPKPPDKDEAAHSCGNPPCVNGMHLRWATYAENASDKKRHGTFLRGEKAPSAKLTADSVRRIRELSSRFSQADLGKMFGIGHVQIWRIINRKQWTHI